MVYSSFLLIIISVLFSLFLFQFLDSPSQKITMRDFHQVTFKQYFYLQQQFNVFVCLLFIFFILFYLLFCVCLCVCGGGGGGGGDVVTKRKIRILIWIQKIHDFSEVPFQCILNDFLLDISMKINLHVWFYFIVFLTILYIT